MGYTSPFYAPNSPKNEDFKKMKKTPRDVIILHKCTKNHDHMLYCSWDMACDGCDCYFSFWAIFCPYPPPLPTAQKKWKVQKNEKNPWIYHLLTQGRVIPCEFTRILKIFPPDPHGFSWNFVRWIMHPSRNENPENFIILSCAVQKLWPTEMWSFYPGYQTIIFIFILKLLLFSHF